MKLTRLYSYAERYRGGEVGEECISNAITQNI